MSEKLNIQNELLYAIESYSTDTLDTETVVMLALGVGSHTREIALAIVNKLVDEGKLVSTIDEGKVYFHRKKL